MKRMKKNSGFTLIELIIAMAMLAFVMTAVSAFMGSGVLSYKKSKADITVHNSAQETYNQIIDSAMQANDIVLYGYTAKNASQEVVFGVEGEDVNIEMNQVAVYYVRDTEQMDDVMNADYYISGTPVKLYSSLATGEKIYVKQMIVETATPFDENFATDVGSNEYENAFTGDTVKIEQQKRVLADGTLELVEDVAGNVVYTVNDTLRTTYTFDDENLYCETEYAYMTVLNDCDSATGIPGYDYLYSGSFNYSSFTDDSDTVSGCVAVVDVNDGAISFDLNFSDKNMTYVTQGMVKFRNSYVVRAKQ